MAGDSPVALFIGSKGGSGTTTLCTELAQAMKATGNVALVDADLTGRRSIAVVLEAVRSLDAARTDAEISSVRADGITVVELDRSLRRRLHARRAAGGGFCRRDDGL